MKPRLDRRFARRKRTWTFVAYAIHTLQRVYRIRIARGRSLLAFPGRD